MNENPLNPASQGAYSQNKQPKAPTDLSLPFSMQVVNNPNITGIYSGVAAMAKSGIQQEFAAGNMIQAKALHSPVILRAGNPPQYNKLRSPKSGMNQTKTSKQGFFKGSLAKEERFSRLGASGVPKPHHPTDKDHLSLSPTDPRYQHVMQLDINMHDILREIGPDGDLLVLGYTQSGLLRLAYKEGRGPMSSIFNGQFIVDFKEGFHQPLIYSREWDKPDQDPNWDPIKMIIKKPPELMAVPNKVYEENFNNSFKLAYTEDRSDTPQLSGSKPAEVFASKPHGAKEFKEAISKDHPQFGLIKNCSTMTEILHILKTELSKKLANELILDVYDKCGRIITGDWDGMMLGHPPNLPTQFSEVINTFAPGTEGLENQELLLARADEYLEQMKQTATKTLKRGRALSDFEKKVLSIPSISEIINDFALARAGCITTHEFVFQQILNHAYRDEQNEHYGEKYNHVAMQQTMNRLIMNHHPLRELKSHVKEVLDNELERAKTHVSPAVFNKLVDHLTSHLTLAQQQGLSEYKLPHLQHDLNINDLYQHGFDMRNPYGSNFDGAWLLISDDGAILYGDTQEQLIEVLLTGNFLEKNKIDINYAADMSVGWGRVIEKQLQLGQTVPHKTLTEYEKYMTLKSRTQTQSQIKKELGAKKNETEINLTEAKDEAKKRP